jgi:hypothetical protein
MGVLVVGRFICQLARCRGVVAVFWVAVLDGEAGARCRRSCVGVRWDAWEDWVLPGDHRSEHRFEACHVGMDTIAGKGGVEAEAGIKPSKGGCCCRSSCDRVAARAAAQRIYGVLGGSGHTSRSPKCTDRHITKQINNKTTCQKQINNKITCQLYLDTPT